MPISSSRVSLSLSLSPLFRIVYVILLLTSLALHDAIAQTGCGGFDGSPSPSGTVQSLGNGDICLNKTGNPGQILIEAFNVADGNNPNNFAVEVDWDDGSPRQIIAFGGPIPVTNPGAHHYKIPVIVHVFLPKLCGLNPGTACAYRPRIYLRIAGSTCPSMFGSSPDFFRYNVENQCSGVAALTETNTGVNVFIADPGSTVTFTDHTKLNCLPPEELTGLNSMKRWRQFVYGTTNTISGTVLVNGTPHVFPYTSGAPLISTEPLMTSAPPYANNTTMAITIPATASAGQEFHVRMDYWNYCNQYGVDPPVQQFAIIRVSGKLAQSITFAPLPSSTYGDGQLTLSATATSGLPVAYSSSNTGVATIIGNAVTIVGAGTTSITATQAGNVTYDPAAPVPRNLVVAKAPITVVADAKSRAYGDANPAFTMTYTGFRNGDTQTVINTLPAANSTAAPTSVVGSYNIIPAGAADDNYTFTYNNGTLSVIKAILNVTAVNKSRLYGDANPPLTLTYAGFKNSETVAIINTVPAANTSAVLTSPVAVYSIVPAGGVDDNYAFNFVNGLLTVGKASITVTADNKSKIYGDPNPSFTLAYAGFKNGETLSVINTAPSAASVATVMSDVGSYPIIPSSGVDDNYAFTFVNGTLTVNKATLNAVADNKSKSYGDPNPTFTIAYTGFKNGDTPAIINTPALASTSATSISNAGGYNITTAAASDNNYAFTYGVGILTIIKAMLTVKADDKNRIAGVANPPFTITYTGFKNGETTSVLATLPQASTAATLSSPAGSYSITVAGGVDPNYEMTYVNGTLTVGKTAQLISFQTLQAIDESTGTLTVVATASSGLPISFTTGNNDKIVISGSTVTILKPGSITITASQSGNDTYEAASSVVQTVCINPRKPIISASGVDGNEPILTSSFGSGNVWYRDGALIPNETASTLMPTQKGQYQVKAVIDGCSGNFSDAFEIIITGLTDQVYELNLLVYPNPAQTDLDITLGGARYGESYGITVYDMSGRIVDKFTMTDAKRILSISHYLAGQYYVKATSAKKILTGRFVKK